MTYTHTASGFPVLQDACGMTGVKSTGVRRGFSDYDVWGSGLAMATRGDCLDAPSALPRGSTAGHYFDRCTGGVGPQSRAFVTQQTTGVSVYGDRT